jgi:hypothetical protein
MADKTVAELLASQDKAKVQSAIPLEQLDEAGKRARFAALRMKMGKSRLAVVGLPGIHYFWADKGDNSEMALFESWGYSLVKEPQAELVLKGEAKAKIQANGLRLDGTYVVGDVILTQCPLETYEFLALLNAERHEELASGAQRDFRTEAEKLAVPVFDHIK